MKINISFLIAMLFTGCAGINAGQLPPEITILEHYLEQVAASRGPSSQRLYFIRSDDELDIKLRDRIAFPWLRKASDFELNNAGGYVLKNNHQVLGSSVKIIPIQNNGQHREFAVVEYSGPLGAVQTFYKVVLEDGRWKIVEITLGAVS